MNGRSLTYETQVADLYDDLSRYVRLTHYLTKKTRKVPAIHKKLNWRHRYPVMDTNTWLLSQIGKVDSEARVLDIACGFGATLLALNRFTCAKLDGITISPYQARIAQELIDKWGLREQIDIQCNSYDTVLKNRFDIMISIESLMHTQNLDATFKNLSKGLKKKGSIFLIEDMANTELNCDLAKQLKNNWFLNSLYSLDDYKKAIARAGLKIEYMYNLTPYVAFRKIPKLEMWIKWLTRLEYGCHKLPVLNHILKSFIGGMILELFYARKKFHYYFIKAVKQDG